MSPEPKAPEPQPTPETAGQDFASSTTEFEGIQTIKLVSVLSHVAGEEVETRWGVHPRFQRDLQHNEAKELAEHMNRVARIVGERFAVIASKAQSSTDQQVGNA